MNSRSGAAPSLIIILLTIGLLGIIASFLLMGGSLAKGLGGLKDGREVSCTVKVKAPLIGSNLQIKDQPTCRPLDPCFVSPFKSLSIGTATGASIAGDIGLWQSGVLYATQAVEQGRLSYAKTYTISACIPQEANAVRVGIITETGGVVNDQPVNIQ